MDAVGRMTPWTPARIRALREHARLTQRDLAELCRVSEAAVWFWEAGRRDPNVFSQRQLDIVARRQKFALDTSDGERQSDGVASREIV